MLTVTLEFETAKLAEEFVGWYDSGGCDAFADALGCRDVVTHPAFCEIKLVDGAVFTHNVKT